MLQDTDFFERFEELSHLGDVRASVDWSESASPDERYSVDIVWRFRGDQVGTARIVIEPVMGKDEHRLFWVSLEWIKEWQGKGLYSALVKSYRVLPEYGITGFIASPLNKTSEAILASQGFAWVGHEFVLDLRAP